MRDWKRAGGVTVTSVAPEGPAAKASLRQGDVLTEANGRPLRNYLDWEAVKLDLHVGDSVQLSVRSGRQTARRRVITGDLPTVTAEKYRPARGHRADRRDARDPGRARAPERAGRAHLQGRARDDRARPPCARATSSSPSTGRRSAPPSRSASCSNVRAGEIARIYLEREGQITFTDLVFR